MTFKHFNAGTEILLTSHFSQISYAKPLQLSAVFAVAHALLVLKRVECTLTSSKSGNKKKTIWRNQNVLCKRRT